MVLYQNQVSKKGEEERKQTSFTAFSQQSRGRVVGFECVCYKKCKGQLISDSSPPPEAFCITDEAVLSTDLLEVVKRKIFLNLYLKTDSIKQAKMGQPYPPS